MFKSVFFIAVLSLLASPAFALSTEHKVSLDDVQRFFEEENLRPKSRAVTIVHAHANLDFAFGFADGRYKLMKYKIRKVRPNIYALGMVFQKKKGMAVYNQNHAAFFWFDGGEQIIFKDGDRKKVYDVRRTWHLEKRETSNGHDIEISPRTKNIDVQLRHKVGTVYLTLAVH